MTIKTGTLLITLALISPVESAVYKCIINDKPVFSQLPCAPDAESITIKTPKKSIAVPYQGSAKQKMQHRLDAHEMKSAAKTTATKIKKADQRIAKYEREMNNKLNALKRKKGRANNNLAGAQWESSISEEMTAVTNKYTQLIKNAREDKQRLEQK